MKPSSHATAKKRTSGRIARLAARVKDCASPKGISKACSWITPGNRPSEFSLGTGLDFGKVQKREEWTGIVLDVEDLQKSLVDGHLNTAWTAFKEIEMQKLRLLHQFASIQWRKLAG